MSLSSDKSPLLDHLPVFYLNHIVGVVDEASVPVQDHLVQGSSH